MSLIISFDITIKCNSRWEQVSDEGVKCCQSSFRSTHHLQPEHYGKKLENLIFDVSLEAQDEGWVDDGKFVTKPGGEDWEETYISILYCPLCSGHPGI